MEGSSVMATMMTYLLVGVMRVREILRGLTLGNTTAIHPETRRQNVMTSPLIATRTADGGGAERAPRVGTILQRSGRLVGP